MANKNKNKATVWNGPDVKLKIEGVAQITRNKQLRREVVIVKRNESMPYSNVEFKQMSVNVAMDEINYGKDFDVMRKLVTLRIRKHNQNIKEGETLLTITAEQLDTQKNLQTNQSADYQAQLQTCKKYLVVILQDCRQGNTSERSQLCKKK